MLNTLDEAKHDLAVAIEETIADMGAEVNPDDVAHDMVIAIAFNCAPAVGRELCRIELGTVPHEVEMILGRQDAIDGRNR